MLSSSSLDGDLLLSVMAAILMMTCSLIIHVARRAAVRGFSLSAKGTDSITKSYYPYPGQEHCIIIETQPKALNPPGIESDTKSKGCEANKSRIYRNCSDSERSSLVETKVSLIHFSAGKKADKGTRG